jgi:hypothetical protein
MAQMIENIILYKTQSGMVGTCNPIALGATAIIKERIMKIASFQADMRT